MDEEECSAKNTREDCSEKLEEAKGQENFMWLNRRTGREVRALWTFQFKMSTSEQS